MAKQYTEDDLGILVAGDWSLLNSEGAEVMHGAGVRATQRQKPGPWNYPREMVLTFPFSLNQFRDFCDWHTYFQWEVIEAQYLNDDGSLDEDALAELARRGEDAAELVRRYLTGEMDAEKEAGPPPTLDRAEAREAPPTGQLDAPESNEDAEDGRLPDCHGSQALAEDVKARQDRRNQRLNQLGATFVPHGNGWRVNGPRGVLAQLEREERAAGRPKSDKSDLRRDLQAAYERARQGSC